MEGTSTMSTLLSAVGDVFTAVIGWVGDVTSVIVGNDLLLLSCVGIPLVGLGIGLTKRLLSAKV